MNAVVSHLIHVQPVTFMPVAYTPRSLTNAQLRARRKLV